MAKMAWDGLAKRGMSRGAKAIELPHDKSLFGVAEDPHAAMSGLKREFIFPPFSVFNTREGEWQARKRLWLKLGIKSELGRGDDLHSSPGGSPRPACDYSKKQRGDGRGRAFDARDSSFLSKGKGNLANADAYRDAGPDGKPDDNSGNTGVSIFDPVLCELMYRWFCPPMGNVLDPFAGGSVRGIVAAALGRLYTGVDLSGRQVAANRQQAAAMDLHGIDWVEGDSSNIKRLVNGLRVDFVFSCPPYADLEVYSDHPADISNMPYEGFIEAYTRIIRRTCSLLKDNAFAAFVVGEVRDNRKLGGPYYNFVGDTIKAFQAAGLAYYNEAILITAVGSLPIRTKKAFNSARKLGRTHQTVLVFSKGDPKVATAAITGDNNGE